MPSVAIIGTRGYPSYYGGFETAVRKLAPYLADEGWDVTVYSRPGVVRSDDSSRDERVRSVETWGVEQKTLSTLTYGLSAARHAAKERPDVALVMNVANGFWLPLLERAGIPTLVNVDGIEWDRAKWGRVAKWMFRTGARMTAKHGTRMVYDAKAIAQRWKDEFGLDGEFIPYGGDPIDEDLPIEPGLTHRDYVLVVARFVPENTIPEFFEAAPELAEHTNVVIVGSSGYGGDLDEAAGRLAEQHSNIRWLGHVSDDRRLYSLWQHAGVYFHGHSVGGTNPALVQAMASGAPVVARDTVYNREVLGEMGVYVAPTRDSIVDTIVSQLTARVELDVRSTSLIERARTLYSWGGVNRAYESAIRTLMLAAQAPEPQHAGTER